MKTLLLQAFEEILKQDKTFLDQSSSVANVETQLVNVLLDKKMFTVESVVEASFFEIQETITAINSSSYPFQPSLIRRMLLQVRQVLRKKLLPDMSQQLQKIYGLDEAFFELVDRLVLAKEPADILSNPLLSASFSQSWPLHKVVLAKRLLLISLSRIWTKENVDEPILWKISDALQTLAKGSFFAVTESFAQVCLNEGASQNVEQHDTISSFFVEINDDKAGNILDNLVISQYTYQALVDEGWQPDRWEIENLPMSVSMFLNYMCKNGFNQVGSIGDTIQINLKQATEDYRYRGSPFAGSDDLKKVKVVVPGWENNGKLIIRPKVNEVLA